MGWQRLSTIFSSIGLGSAEIQPSQNRNFRVCTYLPMEIGPASGGPVKALMRAPGHPQVGFPGQSGTLNTGKTEFGTFEKTFFRPIFGSF